MYLNTLLNQPLRSLQRSYRRGRNMPDALRSNSVHMEIMKTTHHLVGKGCMNGLS